MGLAAERPQIGKKTITMHSVSKIATIPYAAPIPLCSATKPSKKGAIRVELPDAKDILEVALLLIPGAVPIASDNVSG